MNSKNSAESIEEFDPFDFLRESLEYAKEDLAIANDKIARLEAENQVLKKKLNEK